MIIIIDEVLAVMNIEQLVTTRRTIKKFKADPVDEALFMKWLQAASLAPNHKMTEPWDIIFAGPETRGKLKHKTDFGGAPEVMAVTVKHGKTELETVENTAAVACFIQNFMLQAWDEGVGTFWCSLGASKAAREVLGVEEGSEVVGIIAFGYPEEIPAIKERISIEDKIKKLP
jgi:nitroreductase